MGKGKIVGFHGTHGSGLAQLQIYTEEGLIGVACDNAPTVRALNALFPGFIAEGHRIDNSVIEGQEITYELDDMGLILAYISKAPEYDLIEEMGKMGFIDKEGS